MTEVNDEIFNKRLVESFKPIERYLEKNKKYYFSKRQGSITYVDWVKEEEACWGWKTARYAQNEGRRLNRIFSGLDEELESMLLNSITYRGDTPENQMYIRILIDELWEYLDKDHQKLFAMILHEHGLEHYTGNKVQQELLKILDSMDLRTDGQIRDYEKSQNLNLKSQKLKTSEESLYYKLLLKLKEIN